MIWWSSFAALMSTFAAAVFLLPQLPTDKHQSDASSSAALLSPAFISAAATSPSLRLLHLASLAAAFGAALWVTFIGGVIMFRVLPRHQFGTVQSHLFPAYFRLSSLCCCLCFVSWSLSHPVGFSSASSTTSLQLNSATSQALLLLASSLAALANLLLLEPATVQLMRERHRVEKEAGIGDEVGLSRNREVAKTNVALAKLNKKFGMWHGMSSLCNLVTLVTIGLHLGHLASKLAW